MTTDPKMPPPVAGTNGSANATALKDTNAQPRDESIGQSASGSPDETRTLFEAGSNEEARLVDAVIEAEALPDGSNPEMPYDVDRALERTAVKPRG